jgi:hypothetical protein
MKCKHLVFHTRVILDRYEMMYIYIYGYVIEISNIDLLLGGSRRFCHVTPGSQETVLTRKLCVLTMRQLTRS